MGKPRAARKQPIVLSSDDEDDERNSPPPPKRPKRGTLISVAQNGSSRSSKTRTRRASSPKPQNARATTKSPAKSPAKPKPVYKPITSFFSNVPPPKATQPTPSPEKSVTSTPVVDLDDIRDSSDDGGTVKRPIAPALRKRSREPSAAPDASSKGSQRFLKAANGSKGTPPPSQLTRHDTEDTRPWNEKYGPVSIDELAVHKKKVNDVRSWLSEVFNGTSRKRLLLLKGPAGSGKTTTMSMLSKELDYIIHEWKNPAASISSSEGFVSVTAQFEDFVGRAGNFGSLAFDDSTRSRPAPATPDELGRSRQLILVEEFPNTFARASSAVQSFRNSVLNYLAANSPSATTFFSARPNTDIPPTPVVMVISETLLSTNTAAADSFTAHRLLGPEILNHPAVTVIEFKAIAPTFMTKALDMVILKEARKTGRKKTVGPQVIQRLAEIGDIRSAISSLEFLCLRGDDNGDWGGKITFAKKKATKDKDTPMTKMEQESLEMVTQRENTLGIFHAAGRVVYNKRVPEDPNRPVPQPPNWFPQRRRPKESEVNVDTLIDELGTDTSTFVASLHENYVLSCQGEDSEETLDSIEGCMDALSDADLLSADRFSNTGFGRRNFSGTTADTLRQDEMYFQTSVRGLLYNLPSPVKRIAPPPGIMGTKGTTKGNAFVMYYPTSLRIWRQQEELGGLLDMWISRVQKGELFVSGSTMSKPIEGSSGGVETWARSTSFNPGPNPTPTSNASEPQPPVLLGSGGSARYELLLERLPYLTRILRKGSMPSPSTAATIREIQKLTSFTGSKINTNPEDDDDNDDEAEAGEQEQWSTDQPETPKKKRRINAIASKKKDADDPLEDIMDKDVKNLMLSDDDIED